MGVRSKTANPAACKSSQYAGSLPGRTSATAQTTLCELGITRIEKLVINSHRWYQFPVTLLAPMCLVIQCGIMFSAREPYMESEITLEIELIAPPEGVGFCLQKGKSELVDYQVSTGDSLKFSMSVRVKQGKNGAPNFLGEFTQGTPKERFVYIGVGEYAGQKNPEWARRVKIHLSNISWQQIEQALTHAKPRLVTSYQATDKDGGPSCASVPLIGGGWSVATG